MAPREDEPPAGAPEWMVTFSDMISLLVTFFILLMTFSTTANNDGFPLAGDLTGPGGVMGRGGQTAPPPPDDDVMSAMDARRGATVPHVRPAHELPESLEEMGQRLSEEHLRVDFAQTPDGLVLSFDERASFRPGSSAVEPALARSLGELGRVFEHYPWLLVVEGHADTEFKPTPSHPSAESLALERAANAASVLLSASGLSPELVQIASLGHSRPRASNASAAERTLNRRVEVRVISLSREHDLARRRREAAEAEPGGAR